MPGMLKPGVLPEDEEEPMATEAGEPELDEAAPEDPEAAPEPAADAGNDGNVSPEEQAEYERFVTNGLSLIYDKQAKEVRPQVLARLKDGEPIEALANTTVTIIMSLEQSAKGKNAQISPDVLFHGGVEILEDLANLATKAGIHEFDKEEIEGASFRALDLYREMKVQAGEIDPQAAQQDMASIVKADRDGSLEQNFPGLKEHFAAGAKPKKGKAKPPAEAMSGQDDMEDEEEE